jgi:hypothetical protein
MAVDRCVALFIYQANGISYRKTVCYRSGFEINRPSAL